MRTGPGRSPVPFSAASTSAAFVGAYLAALLAVDTQASYGQQLALGAAYTPTSLGPDGKVYSQNAGHLFVMGR